MNIFNNELINDIKQIFKTFESLIPRSNYTPFKNDDVIFLLSYCLICLKENNKIIDDSIGLNDKMTTILSNILKAEYNDYKNLIGNDILLNLFKTINDILNNYKINIICLFDHLLYFYFMLNNKDYIINSFINNLIIKELNIKSYDLICDLNVNAGLFLVEVSKYSKNLFGIEFSPSLFLLAKYNFILHNLNYSKIEYEFNIENNNYDIMKMELINSSYKINQQNFFDNIKMLKQNGIGACIMFKSYFTDDNKMSDFKEHLLNIITPLKIINYNSNNNSENALIIFMKKKYENELVTVINYDNEYVYENNIVIKIVNSVVNLDKMQLRYYDNWNYISLNKLEINYDFILQYKLYLTNKLNILLKYYIYNNKPIPSDLLTIFNNISFENHKIKLVKFQDVFKKLKPVNKINISMTYESPIKKYPLISNSVLNSDNIKYIDNYMFDVEDNEEILIICNIDGSCINIKGKFSISSYLINKYHSLAFILRDEYKYLDMNLLSFVIMQQIKNKYNFNSKYSIKNILNETIQILTID